MRLIFALMLASATCFAEQYQSVTSGGYEYIDFGDNYSSYWDNESSLLSVHSTYYVSPRKSLGPLKEFSYINNVSNLFGGFSYADVKGDKSDSLLVGGEYFRDKLKFGGKIQSTDDAGFYSALVGYLYNPDLLIELEGKQFEDEDEDAQIILRGQYKHQLNRDNYFASSISVDEDLENRTLSGKFFARLVGHRYMAARLEVTDNDVAGQIWRGDVEFYFNRGTSVRFEYENNDNYKLEATHFFDRKLALTAAYGSNRSPDTGYSRSQNERELFSLGVIVQL